MCWCEEGVSEDVSEGVREGVREDVSHCEGGEYKQAKEVKVIILMWMCVSGVCTQ